MSGVTAESTSGVDHEVGSLRSPNQQQEPEPKMESPPRRVHRRKPAIEAGVGINNPDLYAAMSAPFATMVEANAALVAFLASVRALRIKHRIADVVTVALVNIEDVGPVITYGQNGSEEKAPLILAWALGKEQAASKARIEERIAAMVASGGASKPPERSSSLISERERTTSRSTPAPALTEPIP